MGNGNSNGNPEKNQENPENGNDKIRNPPPIEEQEEHEKNLDDEQITREAEPVVQEEKQPEPPKKTWRDYCPEFICGKKNPPEVQGGKTKKRRKPSRKLKRSKRKSKTRKHSS